MRYDIKANTTSTTALPPPHTAATVEVLKSQTKTKFIAEKYLKYLR